MYCFNKNKDRFEFVEKIFVKEVPNKNHLKMIFFINADGTIGKAVKVSSMVKDFLQNNIISSDMLEDWGD